MSERNTTRRVWGTVGLASAMLLVLVGVAMAASPPGPTSAALSGTGCSGAGQVALAPTTSSLAPGSMGCVNYALVHGVLSGHVAVHSLPAAGNGTAYVLWFVNTSSGDKAFLGPLVEMDQGTVLFHVGGDGYEQFVASAWTAGPDAGMPVTMAPSGSNLFVVLAETAINFATPNPVGSVVSGSF